MLKVKTSIRETYDKGIGLFAAENIPAGTVWHESETFFDQRFPGEFVKTLKLEKFFSKYGEYDKTTDSYYLCSDNARFCNHSNTPNTKYNRETGESYTLIDIHIGEEITCDYRESCDMTREHGFDFEVKE